jgi:hypothetical protein
MSTRPSGRLGKSSVSAARVDQCLSEPLPQLLDCRALRTELGVSRCAAEAIMRRLPVVQIEGLRKTFVRREDVRRYLNARTFSKCEVPS